MIHLHTIETVDYKTTKATHSLSDCVGKVTITKHCTNELLKQLEEHKINARVVTK